MIAAGKTGTSSRTSDVWFFGYTSRWMATAWLGDDKYERQLGYKDASFMLSVPMWARFMYAAVGDQPLEEIPWEKPPHVKANDIGGPLKKEFPPPPPPGFDVDGKPIEPPEKLKEQLQKQQLTPVGMQPPKTLVPQKTVRVQSAVKPDALASRPMRSRSRRRKGRRRRKPPPAEAASAEALISCAGVISSSREVAAPLMLAFVAAGCSDSANTQYLPIGSRCSSSAQCGTAPYDCAATGYPYGYCEKPCTTDGDCPADSLCSATVHACRRVCTHDVRLPHRRRLQLSAARERQERLRGGGGSMDGGAP